MIPGTVEQALQAAQNHRLNNEIQRAESLCRQILASHPNHPEALHLLGLLQIQSNRPDAAVELIRRAVTISPANPLFLTTLGTLYFNLNRIDLAIEAWQRALIAKPDSAEAGCNLAVAILEKGRTDEAIARFRQLLAAHPNYVPAISNLAGALSGKGAWDEAMLLCRQALTLSPDDVNTCRVLAIALQSNARFEEAIVWYRRALAHGDDADMFSSLGSALQSLGRYTDAETNYRRAIALNPKHGSGHFNLALLLLLHGDFVQGWREYEWRWDCREYRASRQKFRQPEWDGSDLHGRTILLHTEQGFGDAIQFVRYVPMVVKRGGTVVLGCMQPTTKRLLGVMEGVSQTFTVGEPLPRFDCHCALLSLPRIFGTSLSTIPASHSYLKAEPQVAEQWKARMSTSPARLRVGLVWASGTIAEGRSIPLLAFALLARVPGIRFYSLQKGEPAAQTRNPPPGMLLEDWSDELRDFSDTAALTDNLDLVISVDTAVAHLGGALGKPVFLLVKHIPDWRWMLDREDSPWYPTIRIFRQTDASDWNATIERVVEELEKMVGHTSA